MSISVAPLDATLGAVVTDVDIANLDDATWAEIHEAFLKHGVLVFPGQNLDDEGQDSFARRFGDIEQLSPRQTGANIHISNQKADGTLAKPDEQGFHILRGNEGWHTDSTYMPLASKAAMLSAITLPSKGGGTAFADMRAAWDELDEVTQKKLEGLSAYHSLYYSQMKAGYTHTTDNVYGFHDKGAPLRPIIKTHPETGRKSIYTGRHAYGIPGMAEKESEALLKELLDTACQPPKTYEHKWQVGDTVVWDNRCLMHRAMPYDTDEARVLRGSRIAGERETELAPVFADDRAEDFKPTDSNKSSLAAD